MRPHRTLPRCTTASRLFAQTASTVLAISCFSTPVVPALAAESRPPEQQTAARVDQLLAAETAAAETSDPPAVADDELFLRRLSLDLTGRLPTPGEVTAFTLDPAADKRRAAIDRLLADPRYGRNWGRYWRDAIMYRRSDERALISQLPLEQHLTQQLNDNTPWNEVATGFITALGDVREDGSTGLIMAQQGSPEDTVAEISRLFLGIQIQCAQCHDHKTDRWTREQFHQLAAFFPRVAVRPNRTSTKRTFLVVADDQPVFRRPNNNNRYRGTPEHYMPDLEDPAAKGTKMQPVFFVNGGELPLGARDRERRQKLARWVTSPDNPWFAKALVNRLWAELVGEGFYEPVDDLGPDREATAPQTLEHLAGAFKDSGYDVKWLLRTITQTEVYQRSARPRRSYGGRPFTANCPQRLRSDQLYDALTQVLAFNDRPTAGGRPAASDIAALRGPRGAFAQVFGYDPSVSRADVEGSIPQALALMNSPQINSTINASPYTPLGRMLRSTDDDEDAVMELYLHCLGRRPRGGELATCLEYVEEVGDRDEAFEDLLWSLVNSTEFLYRR